MSSLQTWEAVGIVTTAILGSGTIAWHISRPFRVILDKLNHWIDDMNDTRDDVRNFSPVLIEIHTEIKGIKQTLDTSIRDRAILNKKVDAAHARIDRLEERFDDHLESRKQ